MHSPLPVLIVLPGPFQVVGAMRTTISNMVGVLPPQLFTVTVSTVGESLAQLMFSVLMTGGRKILLPICACSLLFEVV